MGWVKKNGVVALGLMFGWAALAAGPADAQDGPGGRGGLGVVDVSKIFKNYKKVAEVQREMDQRFALKRQALDKQRKDLVKAGQRIRTMRKSLPGDSEFLFDEVQRFQKKEFRFRKAERRLHKEIAGAYAEKMKEVLDEIRAAIRKEAEHGRFQMVFRAPYSAEDLGLDGNPGKESPAGKEKHPLDKQIQAILKPRSTLDLVARIHRNPVLFGAKTVDLTDTVLRALNEAYAKSAAPKPKP